MPTYEFSTIADSADRKRAPSAVIDTTPTFAVVGSIIRLDGSRSSDPDNASLTFAWSFVYTPVGSKVGIEGFRSLEENDEAVSFSPDIVGEYAIKLVVDNGIYTSSIVTVVSVRALLVPHGRQVVPDGKFIWSYIRDAWTQVEGKEWFETLWSTLIQIVGSEMLKLYQVDFNKSIKDIQDLYQRRWVAYQPKLELPVGDSSLILGSHFAGIAASTGTSGLPTRGIIISPSEIVVIDGSISSDAVGQTLTVNYSANSANVGDFTITGVNLKRGSYKFNAVLQDPSAGATDRVTASTLFTFTTGSTLWTTVIASSLDVGDVINLQSGSNIGYYKILAIDGAVVTVSKPPPSASDGTMAAVYRPVDVTVSRTDDILTDRVFIAQGSDDLSLIGSGRVIVVAGECYTISRVIEDDGQMTPLYSITVDRKKIPSELRSQFWRIPNTLISASLDFDEEGVSLGDLLVVDVVSSTGSSVEVKCQVVGVDRNRLGFTIGTDALQAGVVPSIPDDVYLDLASSFGITTVTEEDDGTLSFEDDAAEMKTEAETLRFQRTYWNTLLTDDDEITVGDLSFTLRPRAVIRNTKIPVDDDVTSIPLLQEYIKTPITTTQSGIHYHVLSSGLKEIEHLPYVLAENSDFIINDEVAYEGAMILDTTLASQYVESDDMDFVDKGIRPGDLFEIESPVTMAAEYLVEEVVNKNKLKLSRQVPVYAVDNIFTAQVKITRSKTGKFLRFVPGRFTPSSPAPDRLWAEVTFFDNSANIENNFGILVGLKKEDLENITRNVSYRQAVAGLMYAYTRGSAIEKIRLGLHILLGLPFSEYRGIIRSIEEDYRLNEEGVAILGRVLIEDIDKEDTPLGTLRIYTYPRVGTLTETGIIYSSDAGLGINPDTEEEFAVGDTVEAFTALSKGVEITDYITSPLTSLDSAKKFLQQYHNMNVRINDELFSTEELELVSDFLKQITPAYIAYTIIASSEFVDSIDIQDSVTAAMALQLYDNASLSIPTTLMLGASSPHGAKLIQAGNGVFTMRREGRNLTINQGTLTVTLTGGGFLNPLTGESFEAPLTRIGDYLFIVDGQNTGTYLIDTVSDTGLTVSATGSTQFVGETGIHFWIGRKVTETIATGTFNYTNGSPTVTITGGGLRNYGVSPGDWLTIPTVGRFTIKTVTKPAASWDTLTVDRDVTSTGSSAGTIYRPTLFPSQFTTPHTLTSVGTKKVSVPGALATLAEIGDHLRIDGSDYRTQIRDYDPKLTGDFYIDIAAPAASYTVYLEKDKSTGVSWGKIAGFDPFDTVDIALKYAGVSGANITNTSTNVTFTAFASPEDLLIRPGDLLQFTSGTVASTDVGYGTGTYPIDTVNVGSIDLTRPMATTEANLQFKIIRRA